MCYSNYEGAGVLNTYLAYATRANGKYVVRTVYQASQGSNYQKVISTSSADSIIRVSLSWLNKTNIANFDLQIIKQSNNQVIAEHSCNNVSGIENLRIIQFNPGSYGYGNYIIKVIYQDLNNSTETFSLSWY